jgi:hypothetical protein
MLGLSNFAYEERPMTLAEVLPAVQQLSEGEKLKLIRILTQNPDETEGTAILEPGKTYNLATPYDCFGAADLLMAALQNSDTPHV